MYSKIIPFPLDATACESARDEHSFEVPPAMVEWVSILDLLNPEQHGLGVLEIAEVEAFCSYMTAGFSSANFVARTHDGRRFHLQGAFDEDVGSDITAVSVVQMAAGERLPFVVAGDDPSTHWSAETGPFNNELKALRASFDARSNEARHG
jgi:hypothetical protein